MKKTIMALFFSLSLVAGGFAQKTDPATELRAMVETERDFARTSVEKGTREAFLNFLADDGLIFRNGLVNGKKVWNERPNSPSQLAWKPVFADVAGAGDLGYDTGPWEFRNAAADKKPAAQGFFVTVWRKQPDQRWRAALDMGSTTPPLPEPLEQWKPLADYRPSAKKARPRKPDAAKSELLKLETELNKAAQKKSLAEAYADYADDEVRIYRPDAFPLLGRKAMAAMLSAARKRQVTWQPAAAIVSQSGDLGYAYGTYESKDVQAQDKPVENG